MPSTSPKQARFMQAAAHSPAFAKQAGIDQGVAQEFTRADAKASTSTVRSDPAATSTPISPDKGNRLAQALRRSAREQ